MIASMVSPYGAEQLLTSARRFTFSVSRCHCYLKKKYLKLSISTASSISGNRKRQNVFTPATPDMFVIAKPPNFLY